MRTRKKRRNVHSEAKRHKTANLVIHDTKIIQPTEEIPPGSEFKGYKDYTVQELIISPHNIRDRLAIWKTPTGEYLKGKLSPQVLEQGHFGLTLRSYLLLSLPSQSCYSTIASQTNAFWGDRYRARDN